MTDALADLLARRAAFQEAAKIAEACAERCLPKDGSAAEVARFIGRRDEARNIASAIRARMEEDNG